MSFQFCVAFQNLVEPEVLKVIIGERAEFNCNIEEPVKWYHVYSNVGGTIVSEVLSNMKYLQIYPIAMKDHGFYYCYVRNPNYQDEPEYFLSTGYLKVYGALHTLL